MASEGTYYVPEQSKLPLLASIGMFVAAFGISSWLSGMSGNAYVLVGSVVLFAAAALDFSWKQTLGTLVVSALLVALTSGWLGILSSGMFTLFVGKLLLAGVLWNWFAIAIAENIAGKNSPQLKRSYVWGMVWFIFSEVMFFAAFFGVLFYVRTLALPWLAGEGSGASNELLWPGFEAEWPLMVTPDMAVRGEGARVLGPEQNMSFRDAGSLFTWLPFWNTVILMASSVTVHFAHTAIKNDNRKGFNNWLLATILLAGTFLCLQVYEYYEAYVHMGLTLQSGIYGATFFMLTGFHGVHVLMGTIMLLVMYLRSVLKGHFKSDDNFGFEAASWYWHFVDVVWVGLFLSVYIFG